MNAPRRAPGPATPPLGEREIDHLQALLDALPAPLEPLDVTMLDGYLCGVLVQPRPVPPERWLPYVTDTEGRALPAAIEVQPLLALVRRRHAELATAIERRQWFDPWVFELEPDPQTAPADDDDDGGDAEAHAASEAVFPWVAGFATATALFPALTDLPSPAIAEPLALLFRHLDPDDLEEADDLLALIESLEPPADLPQAVEELVRATLLLADVSRPPARPRPAAAHRRPAPTARGARSGRR